MGNNMVGGATCTKSAKIMKINGEYFKVKTPATVFDVVKDYPGHDLLDAEEFTKIHLRGKPLGPDDELKPKKIYLLVELPKVPSPLRRVRSGVGQSKVSSPSRVPRRSISDLSIVSIVDLDECGSPGLKRVRMRLPKKQVDKIMRESGDQVDVGEKILRLGLVDEGDDVAVEGGGGRGEEGESEVAEKHWLGGLCSPCGSYHHRKSYNKLTTA